MSLGLSPQARYLIRAACSQSQRTPEAWIRDAIIESVAQYHATGVQPTQMLSNSPYASRPLLIEHQALRAHIDEYNLTGPKC